MWRHDNDSWISDPNMYTELRLQAGLSQVRLAELAGSSPSTASCLATGKIPVSNKTIEAFCAVLGCRPEEIAKKYFPVKTRAKLQTATFVRRNPAVDTKVLKKGERYVVNGDFLRFVGTKSGYGQVVHYLFRQPFGGWIISYTNRDFMVGDVSVEAVNEDVKSTRSKKKYLSWRGSNGMAAR